MPGDVFASRAPAELLAAAVQDRAPSAAPAHVQDADALGAAELVGRKARADPRRARARRAAASPPPRRHRCENSTPRAGRSAASSAIGCDRADLVVGVHDRRQHRLRASARARTRPDPRARRARPAPASRFKAVLPQHARARRARRDARSRSRRCRPGRPAARSGAQIARLSDSVPPPVKTISLRDAPSSAAIAIPRVVERCARAASFGV